LSIAPTAPTMTIARAYLVDPAVSRWYFPFLPPLLRRHDHNLEQVP
jgi:hypothetical protein